MPWASPKTSCGQTQNISAKATSPAVCTWKGAGSSRNDAGDGTKPSGCEGYLFLCNNNTRRDVEKNMVLGAPDGELANMKKCIKQGTTKLFLVNFETQTVIGTFVATCEPDRSLVTKAFGGRFSAQVRMTPSAIPLHEAELDRRMSSGVKSAEEVQELEDKLANGSPVSGFADVPEASADDDAMPVDSAQSGKWGNSGGSWQQQNQRPGWTGNSWKSGNGWKGERGGKSNAGAGYVFVCNSSTADKCRLHKLFGAADWELDQMRETIKVNTTPLLVFNLTTRTLLGPFVATKPPAKSIVENAFGGKFNAQVSVRAQKLPLREVKVEARVFCGPKDASEMEEFHNLLQGGDTCSDSWDDDGSESVKCGALPNAHSQVPVPKVVAKRPRQDDSSSNQVAAKRLCGYVPPGTQEGRDDGSGYVFLCNNSTEAECKKRNLFGTADRELSQMQKCISVGTKIMLFNFQSQTLMGFFAAVGSPDRSIEPEAFGGKFSSQVRVTPHEGQIFAIKQSSRVSAGPKTAKEVEAFEAQLSKGEADESWGAVSSHESGKGDGTAGTGTNKSANRPVGKSQPVQMMPPTGPSNGTSTGNVAYSGGSGADVTIQEEVLDQEGNSECAGEDTAGYVFVCDNASQQEGAALGLVGSPEGELEQMQRCIQPDTQLFLFNRQSKKLIGTFIAIGIPKLAAGSRAFGGKCNAQLQFLPLEEPLLEMQANQGFKSGPLSIAEVDTIQQQLLHDGVDCESWSVAAPLSSS